LTASPLIKEVRFSIKKLVIPEGLLDLLLKEVI